jgi:hypothetical protein
VDGDAFREKWKRPFRKKLPLQYLKRSVICKARNLGESAVNLAVAPKAPIYRK